METVVECRAKAQNVRELARASIAAGFVVVISARKAAWAVSMQKMSILMTRLLAADKNARECHAPKAALAIHVVRRVMEIHVRIVATASPVQSCAPE
jgi:hypothetical protein